MNRKIPTLGDGTPVRRRIMDLNAVDIEDVRKLAAERDEKNKPVAEVSFNGRVWPYGAMQAALPRPGRTAPAKPQPLCTP